MEKAEVVTKLNGSFTQAPAAFVFDYTRCTCAELTTLRQKLKGSGAKLGVVKNTLARRALQGTAAEGLQQFFKGQTAVIWADKDPVQPAKVLAEFAKAKEGLAIRAGVVDGAIVDASGIQALATLPSREQLIGKLLSLLNAPATQLAQQISAPASSLARVLGAWQRELEKKGEA